MNKSIVFPAFFPNSINSLEGFEQAVNLIKDYDISVIEFYYEGNQRERIKQILAENKYKSVFLGAILSKREHLNLSSLDERTRREAIEKMKDCIDNAYYFGAQSLLINSGKKPDDKSKSVQAYNHLKHSINELLRYASEKKEKYLLEITLESGDVDVEIFDLIGCTDLAIKLVEEIRRENRNFGLTLDTSHLRQLNEEPITSIKKAFFYCNHIHLANCVVRDKSSDFYGDKHPMFGIDQSEFDIKDIKTIYEEIVKLYKTDKLTIGMEIICRTQDSKDFFEAVTDNLKWFFVKEE